MVCFIVVVVGLSLVFGVLTLAIAAEIYYMIWWRKKKKKPLTAREIDEVNTSYVQELLYVLSRGQQEASFQSQRSEDPELGSISSRSLLHKPSSSGSVSGSGSGAEESVESELMRLHNLSGPPRFLFTIKEETREDLDSEDRSRKGSRTRSLSDVILTCDTPPFLTPIASPRIASPRLLNSDFYNHLGFNPLYEATSFQEIESRLKQSPPPKFKFLRDAEEKACKRLKEHMLLTNQASVNNKNASSASSKVLPLPSSPSRFKLEVNH